MSEQKAFLEKVHIKNFLSLRNVKFSIKPLTVLVGPNASGKSNVLESLRLLKWMLVDKLPPTGPLRGFFWGGEAKRITFQSETKVAETPTEYQLVFKVDEIPTEYQLTFEAGTDKSFIAERLSINNIPVISIQNGQGNVQNEDGTNQTKYRSNQLALESAGDYGDKPITSALTKFIKGWKFYDFQTDPIRLYFGTLGQISMGLNELKELRELSSIPDNGSTLAVLFHDWYENDRERFYKVSESLAAAINTRIDFYTIAGNSRLCLLEPDKKPIPLERASNGTVRFIAYCTLLNQPELPPLIAIEEPERSLHPGALKDIAYILERLAERTQVIITTHSSQLLDTFNSDDLSDWLGVLLLRNRPGLGTEVLNLEEIRDKREALAGWIADFGIGSAVFDSGLLQDLMEEPVC